MAKDFSNSLRLYALQQKAEAHLKVGLETGNRSLVQRAADMVVRLDEMTRTVGIASSRPYCNLD